MIRPFATYLVAAFICMGLAFGLADARGVPPDLSVESVDGFSVEPNPIEPEGVSSIGASEIDEADYLFVANERDGYAEVVRFSQDDDGLYVLTLSQFNSMIVYVVENADVMCLQRSDNFRALNEFVGELIGYRIGEGTVTYLGLVWTRLLEDVEACGPNPLVRNASFSPPGP